MWKIWIILAGIFFIGEIVTVGFLIFWLAIGALIAMVVSFFTSNLIIQTTIFVVSSTILIFATKPFVKKFANIKTTNTNAFSIIEKKGIVIKDIDPINSTGQIKINGEIWSADSIDSSFVPEGSEVEVLQINGVKAIVKVLSVPTKISS